MKIHWHWNKFINKNVNYFWMCFPVAIFSEFIRACHKKKLFCCCTQTHAHRHVHMFMESSSIRSFRSISKFYYYSSYNIVTNMPLAWNEKRIKFKENKKNFFSLPRNFCFFFGSFKVFFVLVFVATLFCYWLIFAWKKERKENDKTQVKMFAFVVFALPSVDLNACSVGFISQSYVRDKNKIDNDQRSARIFLNNFAFTAIAAQNQRHLNSSFSPSSLLCFSCTHKHTRIHIKINSW